MSKSEKDYGYNEDGEKILAVVKRKNYEIEFVKQKNANKNLEEFYRAYVRIIINQLLRESKKEKPLIDN